MKRNLKDLLKMAAFIAVSVILSNLITIKLFGMDSGKLFSNMLNNPKLDVNLLGFTAYLLLIIGLINMFMNIDEKLRKK